MSRALAFLDRYRVPLIAVTISAAVHAAVMAGLPERFGKIDEAVADESYTATLEAEPSPEAKLVPAPPAPKPAPKRVAKPRPVFHPIALPGEIAEVAPEPLASQVDTPVIDEPAPPPEPPKPDVVAMAQPAVPAPAPEPPKFPVEALPSKLTIEYQLSSAFVDGTAAYHWNREGDNYTITGEAQAEGFFTLFLQGRLLQEARGTVTAEGLRPDSYTEHKPGNPIPEGIAFDWKARKVTLDKGDNKPKTVDLTGNTVDWLSMIFQLAHAPPTGQSYDLRVFTQRRFYEFHLELLGVEEIDIPLGKVKALHVRHTDPKDGEVIDVWLGVDQHYLPVKLRFPVAKNHLTVEQAATKVSE